MKQVHNVRVRVIDRNKQFIEQLLLKFLADAGIETKQAAISFTQDGETEDPLFIGELWLDRQQPVRKAVAMLVEKMNAEDKTQVKQHPEKFIDMATHCFFRFDKTTYLSDELRLSNEPSTMQIRLNIAAFPATKEKAVPILANLLSEGNV